MRLQHLTSVGWEGALHARTLCIVGTAIALAAGAPARAQRADENAVTAAEDAFGTTVGYQSVGLYNPNDARGFSPQQAGNLRIEGLYFDQQTWVSGDCMVRETTMRVGIAAQSYAFPAPTGIADLSLRKPGEQLLFSAVLTRGPFESETADAEAQLPLLEDRLGVDLCAGYRRDFASDLFRQAHTGVYGTTFRWRPVPGSEITPFWSDTLGSARRVVPLVYTDGTVALQPFGLRDLGTQAWTRAGWHQTTFGVVAKSALGERWALAAGVFHSREKDPQDHSPYLTLTSAHTVDATMDIVPPFHAESTSGEVRVARLFADGQQRRKLELAVRGRNVNREFGGDSITELGSQPLLSQEQIAPIAPVFAAAGHDATKQLDVGLTYEERWQGLGSLAVGVLRDHYQRTVTELGRTDTQRTTPALVNVRVEVERIRSLVLYSSYVQGLEDSALAPLSADNRNEPPPATRTWQLDGGVRWAPTGALQVIFAAFDIRKPYFNVGLDNVYRQLGRVEHRGLEGSMSYRDAGLTLLLGGVLLRSHVERALPEPGATGSVPLGPVPSTLTANADYSPAHWRGWGASLQLNRLSARVATTDDAAYLPAFTTLGAGVRYRWLWSTHPWTVRLDGFNLTDAQGLNLSSLEAVLPDLGRRFVLSLATDL